MELHDEPVIKAHPCHLGQHLAAKDLGFLAVHTAYALATGTFKPGQTTLTAGRLGSLTIQGDNVLLGVPFTFTKDNVDQFDF